MVTGTQKVVGLRTGHPTNGTRPLKKDGNKTISLAFYGPFSPKWALRYSLEDSLPMSETKTILCEDMTHFVTAHVQKTMAAESRGSPE